MSQLTPEQIELVKQALDQAVQQKIAQGKLSPKVTTEQLLPDILAFLNQLPPVIVNLATTPVTILTTIINSLLEVLENILGVTGLVNGGGLSPNLVNIIKKEIPVPNQQNE